MKQYFFYKSFCLLILLQFTSCSKENNAPEKTQTETETETQENYTITVEVQHTDFENPDSTVSELYEFDLADTRNARVSTFTLEEFVLRAIEKIPLQTQVDIFIQAEKKTGSSSDNEDLFLEFDPESDGEKVTDLENKPIDGNLKLVKDSSNPRVSRASFRLNLDTVYEEVLTRTLLFNFAMASTAKKLIELKVPHEIVVELLALQIQIIRQATFLQQEERIVFRGVNRLNLPKLLFDWWHAVGRDTCPMPMFYFRVNVMNSVATEVRNNILFAFTGFRNQALVQQNQSEATATEADQEGEKVKYYPPGKDYAFNTFFFFNCIAAINFQVQGALQVIYKQAGLLIPVLSVPAALNMEMK